MTLDAVLEKGLLPDFIIRAGIRRLLKQRLHEERVYDPETEQERTNQLIDFLRNSPVAVNTADANEQHYEVPARFYELCLGKNLKYSSGYFKEGVYDLDTAETDMLALTCQRAEITDGMDILELGCGWGSLTLYMAATFPHAKITGVSNSASQKEFIEKKARERGLANIRIITSDMNVFFLDELFDRVVSVEMFEHMRNYRLLLEKISRMMRQDAKLFAHLFTHRSATYLFEAKDESDWMSRYFFTGGIMPSNHLLLYFNDHILIERQWTINGTHYGKTAEHWLKNMDRNKSEIHPLFVSVYGKHQADKYVAYWRIFYMACAELWNFRNGSEWMVSHYLFKKMPFNKR